MSTISENIAIVRRRLNKPEQNAPDDLQLTDLLIDQFQQMHAQLVNTRNQWAVNHFTLIVSQGVEDYLISASDFGRPYLVYTTDPSDTYHRRAEIPIRLMNDTDQDYRGPQQTFSASQWSAVEMVFYRTGQNWYVRPVPIPGNSGQYVVWYEANTFNYASPSDVAGLAAFHNLIRCQTALSALPYCVWGDISPRKRETMAQWQMMAASLRDALVNDIARYQREFDLYRSNSSREQVNDRYGYGGDYEDDYYGSFGVGVMTGGWGV